jgi:hypothetical protein
VQIIKGADKPWETQKGKTQKIGNWPSMEHRITDIGSFNDCKDGESVRKLKI